MDDAYEVPQEDRIADLLRRLHAAEHDHHVACELLAKMHAAAVGEVRGPSRGVVEDIADLKSRADSLQERLNMATDLGHEQG